MKRKMISFLLALAVLLTAATCAQAASVKQFTDVNEHNWYYNAVSYVTANGLFSGTTDKTFSPNRPMTRGMLVTVLGRNSKVNVADYQGNTVFRDVNSREYYAPYINWSHANDIVSGLGHDLFGPERLITREQVAAILYRYAKSINYDTTINNDDFYNFNDFDKTDDYAVEPLRWAVSCKFINGDSDGNLNPLGYSSRAMVAQILYNARSMLAGASEFAPDPDLDPDITPTPTPTPQPTPKPDVFTVYWVDSGDVYHSTRNCVSLKRSTNIRSGSVNDANKAGKQTKCKLCF